MLLSTTSFSPSSPHIVTKAHPAGVITAAEFLSVTLAGVFAFGVLHLYPLYLSSNVEAPADQASSVSQQGVKGGGED